MPHGSLAVEAVLGIDAAVEAPDFGVAPLLLGRDVVVVAEAIENGLVLLAVFVFLIPVAVALLALLSLVRLVSLRLFQELAGGRGLVPKEAPGDLLAVLLEDRSLGLPKVVFGDLDELRESGWGACMRASGVSGAGLDRRVASCSWLARTWS